MRLRSERPRRRGEDDTLGYALMAVAFSPAFVPAAADFNQDGGIDGSDVESFVAWEVAEPCRM